MHKLSATLPLLAVAGNCPIFSRPSTACSGGAVQQDEQRCPLLVSLVPPHVLLGEEIIHALT